MEKVCFDTYCRSGSSAYAINQLFVDGVEIFSSAEYSWAEIAKMKSLVVNQANYPGPDFYFKGTGLEYVKKYHSKPHRTKAWLDILARHMPMTPTRQKRKERISKVIKLINREHNKLAAEEESLCECIKKWMCSDHKYKKHHVSCMQHKLNKIQDKKNQIRASYFALDYASEPMFLRDEK